MRDPSHSPTPDSLIALLGGFPERPPLDLAVLGHERDAAHVRRLVEYTTVAGERVQAFLLTPATGARPVPGALAIHQDGARRPYDCGKSEPAGVAGDPDLAYGLELCRRGYAVICPDRFPFESRSLANSPHREAFARFRIHLAGADGQPGVELTEDLYGGCMANRLLYEGWTPLGKQLFELARAIDALQAQPEVDQDRLGVIGHSGGGLLAAYLMYVDPRIRVGCSSCGTWTIGDAFRSDHLRPMQGFGAATPGMRSWGDTDDVLAGIAPRPWFEAVGDYPPDQVPDDHAPLTAKARARYASLGAAERFRWIPYAGNHIFRRDMRERAYAWFDQWLR
jgi:dienelactone hydrolase